MLSAVPCLNSRFLPSLRLRSFAGCLRQDIRVYVLLSALMLLSSPALPQATSEITATGNQHTISGQVVNGVTGSPIPRALVRLRDRAMLTDQEGRFEFGSEDAGNSLSLTNGLSAEKPGFFGEDGMRRSNYLPPSTAESTDTPLVLRLYPEALISGTIQAADGGPLSNAAVRLRKRVLIEGIRQWQNVMQTRTNAEGEFRFAGLAPGDYNISTLLVTERGITNSPQEGYLPEHYPPSLSNNEIPSMHLSTGQNLSIQLAPKRERFYKVSGHVVNSGDARWGRFQVQTSDRESVDTQANFLPQDGSFHMTLPNGAYEISATFYSTGIGQRTEMRGTAQVTVAGGDVQGIGMLLQPATSIPVLVDFQQTNTTSSATQARVPSMRGQDYSPLDYVNVQLLPISSSSYAEQRSSTRQNTGGQNRLSIPNVSPGTYKVIVHSNGQGYVKSITCGGDDLARDPLTIASGSSQPIRILLQDDVGRVKVRVSNNGQPAQSYLYLIPAEPSSEPMKQASPSYSPQNNGIYTFASVAPGNYLVLAYDHRQELEYRNPEVLRRLLSVGKSVTVPSNGEVSVDVDLIQTSPGER